MSQLYENRIEEISNAKLKPPRNEVGPKVLHRAGPSCRMKEQAPDRPVGVCVKGLGLRLQLQTQRRWTQSQAEWALAQYSLHGGIREMGRTATLWSGR